MEKARSRSLFFLYSGLCLFFVTLPGLGWLVLPGLIFFLAAISGTPSWRQAFWQGWLVGALKLAGGLAWLWSAYPLVWLGTSSLLIDFLLILCFWIIASMVGGLGLAVAAVAVFYFRTTALKWWMVAFPALWLVGELLMSFFVSVLALGPGSNLNFNVTYGYIGLPLASLDLLLPLARFGGVYALTFVAAWFGAIGYTVWQKERSGVRMFVSCTGLVLVAYAYHWVNPAALAPASIMAVDTSFTAASQQTVEGREIKRQELTRAVEAALREDVDYVLLPEDSRLTRFFSSTEETLSYFKNLSPDSEAVVVDTARIELSERKVVLRAFVYDLARGEVTEVDKQFLVPQGEYTPYFYRALLKIVDSDELIADMDRNHNYVSGPLKAEYIKNSSLPGILFCYGSASGLGVRGLSGLQSAPVILHPVSHSWFNEPVLMWRQLDLMLRIHAVWSQKPIVSAGNLSSSRLYRPDGGVARGEEVGGGSAWSLIRYDLGR